MQIIKSFFVFKNDKATGKAPSHKIMAKIGEEFVEAGAGWTKEGRNGKFISAQLSKEWKSDDGTKSREGYVMVAEKELKDLYSRAGEEYPEIPL